MTIPIGTFRTTHDNLVRNGHEGGIPVGSPEAAAVIRRVGEALFGRGKWMPHADLSVVEAYHVARTRKGGTDWMRQWRGDAEDAR